MKIVFLFASLLLVLSCLLSAKPIAPPEFDTLQKRLFFFVCDGNIEGIDAALGEGADINAVEKDSYPLLHISIFQENHEVFEHLLKKGADIHAFSDFGNCNALSLATIYGRREMVIKLLDAGADPNATEEERYMKEYSAIAYAALYGHVDLLKLFAERGGDMEKPLRWPMWSHLPAEFPLLSVAAQHGGVEVVRYLVEERGHAVNPTGKIPVLPPLSVAVRYNNMEVTKYLISKGADVNAVGHDYFYKSRRYKYNSCFLSPLGVAALYGRVEMVKLLFEHGAKVREDVKETEHPMYWADWAGYYRVIEEFEKEGYTCDKWWAMIERRFKAKRRNKKEAAPIVITSEYTPTFLRGHSRQWEIADGAELNAPLRLAVIADDQCTEVADLLTVALSGKEHLELIERSALDEVLREQKLNRAGITDGKNLSLVSGLLDAQALILIEKLTVNKKQVFQLRLVNSILGLQFGRNFIEEDALTFAASVERYAEVVGTLTNKFRRNYKQAVPLSLVNVRADLGTVEGLKIENTLKQLLELELLAQPSVILTQREDMEALVREKDFGGHEEEFKASGIFVDVGVQLDVVGEQPETFTLRIQSASGESYMIEFEADGQTLDESAAVICRAVVDRLDASYTASASEFEGELSKDAEAYFREATWHFSLEQYQGCLENIRTAISLGYNERAIWDYYFQTIQIIIDGRREHRGDEKNNYYVLALERERLVALEGILMLYRSDVEAKALRPTRFRGVASGAIDMEGFVQTLSRFRPVAMQRRYAKELEGLERQFLRIINDYIIPCFAEPMPHGKYPFRNFPEGFFQAVDLMSQLDDIVYEGALDGLVGACRLRVSRGDDRQSIPLHNKQPPVAESRWLQASLKSITKKEAHKFSARRLMLSYFGVFNSNFGIAPRVPVSVRKRQEIAGLVEVSLKEIYVVETHKSELLYEHYFSAKYSGFKTREGCIPLSFQRFGNFRSLSYETWMVQDAIKHSEPFQLRGTDFLHIEALTIAIRKYLPDFEDWHSSHKYHSSLEERISGYQMRFTQLTGTPLAENKLIISELPIRLWSPQKNGFPGFSPLHKPVVDGDSWVVLAAVSRGSGKGLKDQRYALLEIKPATLETKARWINQSLSVGVEVAKAGKWLALAAAGKPIKMIHLDTLEIKELPGYIPTNATSRSIDVASRGGRFFFFVQPESLGYSKLHGQTKSRMQILLRYNPDTDVSEVVYNTRRNPPQNILDGTGIVYDVAGRYSGSVIEDALIIYDGPNAQIYWVDTESMEIRKTTQQEFITFMSADPSRLSRSTTIEGVSWGAVVPGVNKEQQEKLPEDNISLVLQSRERDDKGRIIQEKRKAVLPIPQKKDPNYPMYLERLGKLDPLSNSAFQQNYIYRDNHRFGEHYGYIDYNTHSDDEFWGIFKMSDLAEALENSPEL